MFYFSARYTLLPRNRPMNIPIIMKVNIYATKSELNTLPTRFPITGAINDPTPNPIAPLRAIDLMFFFRARP